MKRRLSSRTSVSTVAIASLLLVRAGFVRAAADEVLTLAQQTDGRLVATGRSCDGRMAVVRYDADGTGDVGFGTGGTVTQPLIPFGGGDFEALIQQADGKLLAGGTLCDPDSCGAALVRYDADGTLDATFGTGGVVRGPLGTTAVFEQADGKVVALGSACQGNDCQYALTRYAPDGSVDTAFGTDGSVTLPVAAYRGVQQTDGKLVLAGYSLVAGYFYFDLVRYDADGTLDAGFGTGGMVSTLAYEIPNAIVQQADGKLVVAGGTRVVRYEPDGTLDGTFGTAGITMAPPGLGFMGALVQQSDGKLVGAGGTPTNHAFFLVRFDPDGSVDGSFGSGGVVITPTGGIARGIVQQADGKLVAAGGDGAGCEFALARYGSDGSLDAAFGTGGTVETGIWTDRPIGALALTLRRSPTGKARGAFVSRDPALFPTPLHGPDDPRDAGAALELLSANANEGTASLALPAAGWNLNSSGTTYRFADKTAPDAASSVNVAIVKQGRLVKIKAKSAGLPLAEPQGTVAVRLRMGRLRSCARFGGTVVKDEQGEFAARDASTAGLVDCSDARLLP